MRKRIFWGIIFISGAAAVILSGLGVLKGIGFWTIVLGIFLIGMIFSGVARRKWGIVIVELILLLWLVCGAIGVKMPLSVWQIFGAGCLAMIGLHFLFPHNRRRGFARPGIQIDPNLLGERAGEYDIVPSNTRENVNCNIVFGSSVKYITSPCLRQVSANIVFSNLHLYLDNAVLVNGEAVVNVDAVFSSMAITVPKEWRVKTDVEHIFSEVDGDDWDGASTEECILYIVGKAVFSSVKVYRV